MVADKVKANLQAVVGESETKPAPPGNYKSFGVSPAGLDRNGNYNVKVGLMNPGMMGNPMPRSPIFWNMVNPVNPLSHS